MSKSLIHENIVDKFVHNLFKNPFKSFKSQTVKRLLKKKSHKFFFCFVLSVRFLSSLFCGSICNKHHQIIKTFFKCCFNSDCMLALKWRPFLPLVYEKKTTFYENILCFFFSIVLHKGIVNLNDYYCLELYIFVIFR